MRRGPWQVGCFWTAAIAVSGALACLPVMAQDAAPNAMEVGVQTLERQSVPRVFTLPGRAVAYEEVDIRPRVDGVVEKILFTPGAPLAVGDPLFQLDDASYRASVASDQADLASAEANLTLAQAAYDRAQQLQGSGYTVAEVEEARATLAEAKAQLDAAKSALDYAQTELSWTTIRSPIEGVASVATVSVGALLTSAQSDELTTVTRLDPIDVDMLEASTRMLSIRQEIEDGTLSVSDQLDASLTLENGETYQGKGKLIAPGNSVATSTGTFTLRFRFDNPERKILPGMFLRGDVTLGTIKAFLVPQRAASRGNGGQLTAFIVGDDGTAQQVTLSEVSSWQNNWVVTEGLEEGDRLIVDGLKSMRAGTAVTPIEVTLNEAGLVQTPSETDKD